MSTMRSGASLPAYALLVVGVISMTIDAGAKPKGKTKRGGPAKSQVAPPSSPAPATPAAAAKPPPTVSPAPAPTAALPAQARDLSSKSTAELLTQAKALYSSLEYEQVIPLAMAVLSRDNVHIKDQLEAYLLHGSALAVVGDAIEAEKPFRFLLRGRPDFEMSNDTPPKILAVFRKVQAEERAITDQMQALALERITKSIELKAETPNEAQGGQPLAFAYRLKDPYSAVTAMEVHYRREPTAPFSTLALRIDEDGRWTGELPGEWTANENGFDLEYFLASKDSRNRPLASLGAMSAPLKVQMAPGEVSIAVPFYKTWWFWAAAGGVLVAGGASGYLAYKSATELPQADGVLTLKE